MAQRTHSAGLGVNPEALVTQLRDYLKGYSREDIIRELLQNADDARASRLYFYLLENGVPQAVHPLLERPGLLMFNDGPLKDADVDAIRYLIGGSKAQDESKVGRFGLGLKSLFHLCDVFFYDAFVRGKDNYHIKGVLFDPLYEARSGEKYASRLQQWEDESNRDAIYVINKSLNAALPGEIEDGFFIYAPLRDTSDGYLHIRDNAFAPGDMAVMLRRSLADAVPAFAQCANLAHVEAYKAESLTALTGAETVFSMRRSGNSFLGRPGKGGEGYERELDFRIKVNDGGEKSEWQAGGLEIYAPGYEELARVNNEPGWPRTGLEEKPEKGAPHAAVTLLATDKGESAVWRWASFYPLTAGDRAPVEQDKLWGQIASGAGRLELLLHGYFFVNSSRKHITGITASANDNHVQAQWNRIIRDGLLLPLLPRAIYMQWRRGVISEEQMEALCSWCREHVSREAITSGNVLVKNAGSKEWELLGAGVKLYALPDGFATAVNRWLSSRNEVFIFRDKGIYGACTETLDGSALASLLKALSEDKTSFDVRDIGFVEKLAGQDAGRYAPVLRDWFIDLLAQGYFSKAKDPLRDELVLFAARHMGSIAYAPMETAKALQRLAREAPRLLKVKLILPKVMQKGETAPAFHLSQISDILKWLDGRLRDKAKQLEEDIRLAEFLRPRPMPADMEQLTLVRVSVFRNGKRIFGEKDAARSTNEVLQMKREGRLFIRDAANTVSDELLKLLSAALATEMEIWRLAGQLDTGAGFQSGSDGASQACRAIMANASDLSGDEKNRLELYNWLLENWGKGNSYKALRCLIAGRDMEDHIPFIKADSGSAALAQGGIVYSFPQRISGWAS